MSGNGATIPTLPTTLSLALFPAHMMAAGAIPASIAPTTQQQQQLGDPKSATAAAVAGKEAPAYVLPSLPRPYLQVPASLSLAALRAWLQDQLQGQGVEPQLLQLIQLETAQGMVLQPGQSLQQLAVGQGRGGLKAGAAAGASAGAMGGAAAGDGPGGGGGSVVPVKQEVLGVGAGGQQVQLETREEAPAGEVLLLLFGAKVQHGGGGAGYA